MKEYPSIPDSSKLIDGRKCIAFDKLDGSNLRYEWSRNQGWYKFGTRRRLFDRKDSEYGAAVDIFLNKYADPILSTVTAKHKKVESLIAYCEFLGPNSFAGKHVTDDPKDVVLFDINIHKKGIVSPRDFVDHFGHLHIPKVVYEGPLDEDFVADVRSGVYGTGEGVIVKGGEGHKLWLAKIKTQAYLEKLKKAFGTGWKEFWE